MILRKKKLPKISAKEFLKKSKSFSTISVVSAIAVSLLGVTAASMVAMKQPLVARSYNIADDKPIEQTVIKLTKDSHKAIILVNENPVIRPGESTTQREAREKAEAEAAAKAQAQAALASKRNVVTRERRVYVDPSNFDTIYAAAEAQYGVDARLLKAIHYVETGCSGSTAKANPSGATGPMQFLHSTFNRHAVDGNGDGIKDITNVEDSIFTAAVYLRACGYPNLKSALMGYNPSYSYYYKVLDVAESLGYQQ